MSTDPTDGPDLRKNTNDLFGSGFMKAHNISGKLGFGETEFDTDFELQKPQDYQFPTKDSTGRG